MDLGDAGPRQLVRLGLYETDTERTPYEVLIERRPDLPHIALTCENTNTALPRIDLVNEILEYYVAKGKLSEDAARDTGDATTAELLAEPQLTPEGPGPSAEGRQAKPPETLTLWSPIPTTGEQSLYAQLFLTHSTPVVIGA